MQAIRSHRNIFHVVIWLLNSWICCEDWEAYEQQKAHLLLLLLIIKTDISIESMTDAAMPDKSRISAWESTKNLMFNLTFFKFYFLFKSTSNQSTQILSKLIGGEAVGLWCCDKHYMPFTLYCAYLNKKDVLCVDMMCTVTCVGWHRNVLIIHIYTFLELIT